MTVVANADDPVVTFVAEQAPRVIWVGGGQVDGGPVGVPGMRHG